MILGNSLESSLVTSPTLGAFWVLLMSVVLDVNVQDIPLFGHHFTWSKSKGTSDEVEERLDRTMSTQAWFDIFPHCSLSNTISCRLNHSPILMCLFQSSHFVRKRWFLLRIPSLNRMTLIQLSQTSI